MKIDQVTRFNVDGKDFKSKEEAENYSYNKAVENFSACCYDSETKSNYANEVLDILIINDITTKKKLIEFKNSILNINK